MKLDLREKPLSYDGETPVKIGPNEDELSFQEIFTIALNNLADGEDNTGVEEKAKRFALSVKVNSSHNPHFTSAQKTMLEERVSTIFPSPLIYGRVLEILGDSPIEIEEEPTLAAVEDGAS